MTFKELYTAVRTLTPACYVSVSVNVSFHKSKHPRWYADSEEIEWMIHGDALEDGVIYAPTPEAALDTYKARISEKKITPEALNDIG